MHPYLAFQSLPLSGDRTDGAECAVGAPAPLKFRCVCPDAPSDFGVVINSENIESHLENIRVEQARYKQKFPQEVEEVKSLARETAHFRKASKTN
ncbi:MAG: hypothetical protein AAFR83_27075 [Cyanobacteria bacterium J06629_18]